MRGSKYISGIFQMLILAVILVGADMIASKYMPLPDDSHRFNYDVKNLIDNNKTVEMVVTGASRSQQMFVPYVLEEELGFDNVLNTSSPQQSISESYYMLKYLLDEFEPEYVVVGLSWNRLAGEDRLDYNSVLTMERLPLSDSVQYVLDVHPDQLLYLSNLYRYREVLKEDDWLEECKSRHAKLKAIASGTEEVDTEQTVYYAGKGYVHNSKSMPQGSISMRQVTYNLEELNYDKIKYLDKIVNLCEEKGVKLYFAVSLTSMSRIYSVENYQEADDFVRQYAEAHGVPYYNFNYLKNRENLLPDTMMFDGNHVNVEGAEIISEIFSEIIEKDRNGEDTSSYFYASVDELKKDVKRIIAVETTAVKEEGRVLD